MNRVALKVVVTILLLAAFILPQVFMGDTVEAAGTGTTTSNLTLIPTFKCISVYGYFSGDTNSSNSAVLQYKKSSDTTWETGMAMVVDRNAQLSDWHAYPYMTVYYFTNPWYNSWKASIVGLTPNTSYDVRVTFTDSDGVSGTNPLTGTVSTRNETIPIGSTARYVSKSGSNSNDGTAADASHAWLTIAYGLAHITAGQTLYIQAGTYTEHGLNIPSGTSWNNLTSVCNYANDSVTVSGGVTSYTGNTLSTINPFICTGNYWRIKGLTITNSDYAGIEVNGCSHYLIENCSIGNSHGNTGYAGLIYNYNAFDGIMRNITFFNTFTVSDGGPDGPTQIAALTFQESRGQYIVHDITYASTNPAPYFADFIGNHGMQYYNSGPFCDSDFYNIDMEAYTSGDLSSVGDNAFEFRTASCNVRLFDSKFKNPSDCPFSIGPLTVGPCYIFHNVVWRQDGWAGIPSGDVAFKSGSNNDDINGGLSHGYVFVYNNTFYNIGGAYGPWYGGDIWNQTYHNNIFGTNAHSGYLILSSNFQNMHIDYNDYYQEGYYSFDMYYGASLTSGTYYNTVSSFYAASGYEQHGKGVDPSFTNANAGNFALLSNSPCQDAGIVIQGFSDSTGPYPYLGSAPDIGAYESSGAPVPTPTPTPSPSPTTTLSPTPTPTTTPSPSPTTTLSPTPTPTAPLTGTFGDTSVHSLQGYENGVIDAYSANLPVAADVVSVSVYLYTHSGSNAVRLAIYSDSSGVPNTLLAQTASTTAQVGWNTLPISVSLSAGTYWIAVQLSGTDPDTIAFDTGSSGINRWTTYTYGSFPSSFGTSGAGDWYASIYASYTLGETPTPTPTPTPTQTPGDANGDGAVNSLDITKVKRIIIGLDPPTSGADANGDGYVNALDITRLEQIILGY